MSARRKTRAVKGTTLAIFASSLTCRCQSSGAVIVSLSEPAVAETVAWMRPSARRVAHGAARRSAPATGSDRAAIMVSAASTRGSKSAALVRVGCFLAVGAGEDSATRHKIRGWRTRQLRRWEGDRARAIRI